MEGGGGREGGGQGGKGTRARPGRRRAQETLRAGSRPQARGGGGGRGRGAGGQSRVVAIVFTSYNLLAGVSQAFSG